MAKAPKPYQADLLADQVEETGPGFVEVEKNVTSLGFFTPSRSRGKLEVREKSIRFRREENGRVIETTARILPSAKYGLPTTADQDKFLALQKIINDMRLRRGRVDNPVSFTSKEMLAILGLQDAGNNYQDIYDWMDRMTATTIHSNGVVFLADRKMWASNTFHVFDQVVRFGSAMSDGRVADRNYIWLSDWQLNNINNNHLMPVDLETYRKLRGSIAKALVPLLQVWLYASRNKGRFEKRYHDLCEILDIKREAHRAHIRKQLGPSLDELVSFGYLSSWSIEPTSDGREFKLVAEHGPKFFEDSSALESPADGLPEAPGGGDGESPTLSVLEKLMARGIGERAGRKLLRELPSQQPVEDQIAWVDHLIASSPAIKNPPGFYISLLRDNVVVPSWFLQRLEEEATDSERAARHAREQQEDLLFARYRRKAIEQWVSAHVPAAEWAEEIQEQMKAIRKHYPNLVEASQRELAEGFARGAFAERVPLMTLQEFLTSQQLSLFEEEWQRELQLERVGQIESPS